MAMATPDKAGFNPDAAAFVPIVTTSYAPGYAVPPFAGAPQYPPEAGMMGGFYMPYPYAPEGAPYRPPPTVDPLLGESLSEDAEETQLIRRTCLSLARAFKDKFPGSTTSSIARRSISFLKKAPYLTSIKANGTRFLLLLVNRKAYFINRKMQIFNGTPFLPELSEAATLNLTLIDGELVPLKTETPTYRYLIIDGLSIGGNSIRGQPLPKRISEVKDRVLGVLKAAIAKIESEGGKSSSLQVDIQAFYPLEDIKKVIYEICPTTDFESDGLVFTPSTMTYKLGYNEAIVKWKPLNKKTVDFRIIETTLKGKQLYQLQTGHQGGFVVHDWITDSKQTFKKSGIVEGSIIECSWDPNGATVVPATKDGEEEKHFEGGWVIDRIRTDKSVPNEDWVAHKIIESIESHISEEELTRLILEDGSETSPTTHRRPKGRYGKTGGKWKPSRAGRGRKSRDEEYSTSPESHEKPDFSDSAPLSHSKAPPAYPSNKISYKDKLLSKAAKAKAEGSTSPTVAKAEKKADAEGSSPTASTHSKKSKEPVKSRKDSHRRRDSGAKEESSTSS
eukprot:TRINITY_DN4194_c0_g1_i1.p1 TRINITY_DN4194_c0_g1~~TRINITY_DN4194_c0_g1_i1.p1  ORF type:complete len:575 (+),score=108.32 TRINITY_DN4194_c0_g1_i1:44-1726(+)